MREEVAALVDDKSRPRAFYRNRIHEEIILRSLRQHVSDCRRGLPVDAHVDGFVVSERGVAWRTVGSQAAGLRRTNWTCSDVYGLTRAPAASCPVSGQNDHHGGEKKTNGTGGSRDGHV